MRRFIKVGTHLRVIHCVFDNFQESCRSLSIVRTTAGLDSAYGTGTFTLIVLVADERAHQTVV